MRVQLQCIVPEKEWAIYFPHAAPLPMIMRCSVHCEHHGTADPDRAQERQTDETPFGVQTRSMHNPDQNIIEAGKLTAIGHKSVHRGPSLSC